MKVLLDTCAFLWLVTDDPQASELAKEIFLNDDNELFLSAVTGFEMINSFLLMILNGCGNH
jgi:PIN domain nuclease of toxin-antitoxin system